VSSAFVEVHRLDSLWSSFLPGSEVARLNRQRAARVSHETAELIRAALRVGHETGGAFDITVRPVLDAWGFYTGDYRLPDCAELSALLRRVDFRKVRVAGDSVWLGDSVELDLGGIAVGCAVDRVVTMLESSGVGRALVDAGGDIRVFGDRDWRIGVRDPRGPGVVRVLLVRDRAVATSGDYENCFELGGRRYHHIIDVRTGFPATGAAGATVLAPSALEADAFSTAVFALGSDSGCAFLSARESLAGLVMSEEGDSLRTRVVGDVR
jgi:thiamine biosynthesis lipoprotein